MGFNVKRARSRKAIAAIAVGCALGVSGSVAAAHDFWLVPNAFRVAAGGQLEVRGQTSSKFPTSESAVAVDRVADARLVSATGSERLTDLSVSGPSLLLRNRPSTPGQRVVAVTLHPRSVRESAASFRRYLELEGAPQALAQIEREGLLRGRDSVTRRYTKYAKAIVEVGSSGARAFSLLAGHPLEFVTRQDPSAIRVNDTVVVQLLYRGAPLAGAAVHAGVAHAPGGRVDLASAAPQPDLHLATDSEGQLRLPVNRTGLWNVRTIHVVQAEPNSGADWDTHWATLVFYAGEAAGPPVSTAASAAATDSSAVAAVVQRYGLSLSSGDSAAALALLSDDAIILEAGGIETRAEYRSHHLAGDIDFARATTSTRGPINVTLRGDVAWATSTMITQGEVRGRSINSAVAESMVLVRTPDGWKISVIHWSSRARRP